MSTWRGSGLKTRLLHPLDEYWDRRLGVATFGYFPASGQPGDADFRVHYTPMPYSVCLRVLRRMAINSTDVAVDLGCGLGRAVFAASWLGAARAVGIDIVPELIAAAERNAARFRGRRGEVEFRCESAEHYSLADATVIVMFHPFGSGTMKAVIEGLEGELQRQTRSLRVAYVNPVHGEVLDASPSLRRIDHWPARTRHLSGYGKYPVTFWEATAP